MIDMQEKEEYKSFKCEDFLEKFKNLTDNNWVNGNQMGQLREFLSHFLDEEFSDITPFFFSYFSENCPLVSIKDAVKYCKDNGINRSKYTCYLTY